MAAASPSPFATLLRRSKFAAFDPAIAQVYTTYGGDAHRGNWGLKRPLPLRRRQAFITVKTVDSREQQTEWNHGESQARFIRRWGELSVDSRVAVSSPWERKLGHEASAVWMVDSEFAPVADWEPLPNNQRTAVRANTVPNIHAMSHKEFQRYLEKLRKQRPEFQAYIQDLAENNPNAKLRSTSLYELALSGKEYHKNFIAWKLANTLSSMESRNIEQKPHRTGGISYSHISPLQTRFTSTYKPGIILQRTYRPSDRGKLTRSEESFIASFAGLTSVLRMKDAGGKTALLDVTSEEGIKRENVESSVVNLRIKSQPKLIMSPMVVGSKRQGLKGARIVTEVISDLKMDFHRENPHIPGSREYNGLEAVPAAQSSRPLPMDFRPKRDRKKSRKQLGDDGQQVLDTLRVIVKTKERTGV